MTKWANIFILLYGFGLKKFRAMNHCSPYLIPENWELYKVLTNGCRIARIYAVLAL